MKEYTVDDVKEIAILIPIPVQYIVNGQVDPDIDIGSRLMEAYVHLLNRDGAIPVEHPTFEGWHTTFMKPGEDGETMVYDAEPGVKVARYIGTAVITGDKVPTYGEVAVAKWKKAAE